MKSDAKLKIRRFLEQANWHISGRIVVGVGEGASDDLFSLCSKRRFKQATNIRLTLPGGNYVKCAISPETRERETIKALMVQESGISKTNYTVYVPLFLTSSVVVGDHEEIVIMLISGE